MIERTKIKLSLLFLEYLKEILKPDSRTLRKYIRNNRENIDVTYGDFIDLTDIKILYTISDYIAQNQNIFNFKLVITEDLVNLNLTNLLANHNVDDANYVDIGFLSASKIDLIFNTIPRTIDLLRNKLLELGSTDLLSENHISNVANDFYFYFVGESLFFKGKPFVSGQNALYGKYLTFLVKNYLKDNRVLYNDFIAKFNATNPQKTTRKKIYNALVNPSLGLHRRLRKKIT